ncbi:hypothetical protein B0H21DRAFT_729497 [Amylocystis lapponica]|nr:hypothetical protein B0H21DRAFT_729497 [Amylocystis lapponica]
MSLLSQFKLHNAARPQTSEQAGVPTQSNPSGASSGTDSGSASGRRSLSPPSLTQRRGTRRDRDEDNPLDYSLDMREHKRLKVYGMELSREQGAPDDALNEFIDLNSPFYMLVNLKANLLRLQDDKSHNELVVLLDSKKFLGSLRDRLLTCLLSPNLTAYVTDFSANVMAFIKKNSTIFGVPSALLQDHDLMKKLTQIVSEDLTDLRGAIKTKIQASIKKHENIGTLARRLAPSTMEVSLAHWARISFLRSAIIQFDSMPKKINSLRKKRGTPSEPVPSEPAPEVSTSVVSPDDNVDGGTAAAAGDTAGCPLTVDETAAGLSGGTHASSALSSQPMPASQPPLYPPTAFWTYVDDLLTDIRNDCCTRGEIHAEQEDLLKNFFTEIFQNDLKEFPGLSATEKGDKVTVDWQVVVRDQLMW